MSDGDTNTAQQSSGSATADPALYLDGTPLAVAAIEVIAPVAVAAPKALAKRKAPAKSKAAAKPRAEPAVTQAEPTAPRPICPKTGLELDDHGLPTSGPARAAWLAERGIADPALKEMEN